MRQMTVRLAPGSVRAVRHDRLRARELNVDQEGAADVNDWDAELEDDEAGAVVRAVARQLKLWREAAGLTQAELGAAIGYGEELVSSVERGRRIPGPSTWTRRTRHLRRAAGSRR